MRRSQGSASDSPQDGADGERTFAHQAMATTFTLRLVETDARYASQAAQAAFDELDLLERLLSRYVETSDIWRINRLAAFRSTVVALETFQCLEIALEMNRRTGGAFDVAYASDGAGRQDRLVLDACDRTVQVADDGVVVDLGGIGKGFALDHMAAVLREWGIPAALLWASTSTVLAFGSRNWPLRFGTKTDQRRTMLRQGALSASGTAVKGLHIVDPRTGRPAQRRRRAWALAPTAAAADALSTAFMVMTEEEIGRCCEQDPHVAAHLPPWDAGPLETLGQEPSLATLER